MKVVATLAHELGHVILLGGDHLKRDEEDMEPMTDLVTVYLGLGIFTANASRRLEQHQDERKQGWSMSRLGYLPEVVFAYALARFAKERGKRSLHGPRIYQRISRYGFASRRIGSEKIRNQLNNFVPLPCTLETRGPHDACPES